MPERILSATAELIVNDGWSGITMTKVAARAGVSRQTVYNEFGTRPALARAIVMRELTSVLAGVEAAFSAHPGDAAAAVRATVLTVLQYAERNPLLGAALVDGPGNELLAPLTVDSGLLLQSAKDVVLAQLSSFGLELAQEELCDGVNLIARAIVSHMLQPSGSSGHTADAVSRAATRMFGLPRPHPGIGECGECF
ncbi:MAG: TetR family transcriptional regulator [Allobranchiibius sp.]